MFGRHASSRSFVALALASAGCAGPQSALDPAGRDAAEIAELFYWMAGGAVLVWAAVIGLAVYAMAIRPRPHSERTGAVLIVGAGAIAPTILLTILLVDGLSMMPAVLAPGDDSTRIAVSAERFWWRVQYTLPDGESFTLANELRLPVGRRVSLTLTSPDVIHSFWVPSLAGKVDAIPGRETHLALEPTRTGVFRGACAEYCGSGHARMAMHVVVLEPDAYAAWVEAQRAPAREPVTARATEGAALFDAHGCGACHTVRGTAADGVVGPDLTHVGSRHALAAGTLDNDEEGFRRFVAHPDELKPDAQMPSFAMIGDARLRALAAYLDGLE